MSKVKIIHILVLLLSITVLLLRGPLLNLAMFGRFEYSGSFGTLLEETRTLKTIDQLIAKLGQPMYIYERFPAALGSSLTSDETDEEIMDVKIYAFMIQSMPPVFLVARVRNQCVEKVILERS